MKILIGDDHTVVRKGLTQIIREMTDVSIIDEAENGFEVLEAVKAKEYDILILDIAMPDRNGWDVLNDLKTTNPNLPILILSTYPEELYGIRSIKSGASGYLNKSSAAEELVDAIRIIASGRKYISRSLANIMATSLDGNTKKLPHENLTDRELQVFRLLAEGKNPVDIAKELSLSQKTVSTHKKNILEKMNLRGVADLAIYAERNNLLIK